MTVVYKITNPSERARARRRKRPRPTLHRAATEHARSAGGSALVMLALALVPTALAYTCYFRGLHHTAT